MVIKTNVKFRIIVQVLLKPIKKFGILNGYVDFLKHLIFQNLPDWVGLTCRFLEHEE